MFYRGELANFYPPDFLAFLASFDQDGVLVLHGSEPLTIAIKNGAIVDGFSKRADATLLRILHHRKILKRSQVQQLIKAKNETQLSCRQLLASMQLVNMASIQPELMMTIEEVIFHFFLRRSGRFKFTDTQIKDSGVETSLNVDDLILSQVSRVEEWEEFVSHLGELNQLVQLTDTGLVAKPAERSSETMLQLVSGRSTIEQLVSQAPLPDYVALKAIVHGLRRGWYNLKTADVDTSKGLRQQRPSHFLDFKKYFRKMLVAEDLRQKTEQALHYCKKYFDQTLMVAIDQGQLQKCLLFQRNQENRLFSKELSCQGQTIDSDPILTTCYRQGQPFFGKGYDSPFFSDLSPLPEEGECAIIPIDIKKQRVRFLVACLAKPEGTISPLHYLELLSWLMESSADEAELPDETGLDRASKIVNLTEERPPMPDVASRAMEIMNDPESSLEELAQVLNEDPSLLAMIIKVSNSALYSSSQTITTLQGAVAKLGITIIHSLVLTAATSSLFPEGDAQFEALSQGLWRHSKACGVAARLIAQQISYPTPEEAFVGGLLHDIGRLAILLHYPHDYAAIEKELPGGEEGLLNQEQQRLGFDHTIIGQMLADKWHLPQGLQACIEQHHAPETASDSCRQLTTIIALADLLSQLDQQHQISSPDQLPILRKELGLDDQAYEELISLATEQFKHLDTLDG